MRQRDTQKRVVLEVCVDTLKSARAALGAGADRLELCAALSEGGLTPSPGLLATLRDTTDAELVCMLRPRGGDFVLHPGELQQLLRDMDILRACGASGFVCGPLLPTGELDLRSLKRLVCQADPLPITFHRAFDMLPNFLCALEALIEAGCRRLLSSGCAPSAWEGRAVLAELQHEAQGRIELIAGGGLRHDHLLELVQQCRLEAVHVGANVSHGAGIFGSERMCDSEEIQRCRQLLE